MMKCKSCTGKMISNKDLPRHLTGVSVSLKPRKMPWIAKESTTAGQPSALSWRKWCAEMRIGDACPESIKVN